MADVLPDQDERAQRWAIKPEALVAPNGAEITMGIAYGPVPDVETMVLPVSEMVLIRAKLRAERDRLRAENRRLRVALAGIADGDDNGVAVATACAALDGSRASDETEATS